MHNKTDRALFSRIFCEGDHGAVVFALGQNVSLTKTCFSREVPSQDVHNSLLQEIRVKHSPWDGVQYAVHSRGDCGEPNGVQTSGDTHKD